MNKETYVRHISRGALTCQGAPLQSYDNLRREWIWVFYCSWPCTIVTRTETMTSLITMDTAPEYRYFLPMYGGQGHARHFFHSLWHTQMRPVTPLTSLRTHEYEPFSSLLAYYLSFSLLLLAEHSAYSVTRDIVQTHAYACSRIFILLFRHTHTHTHTHV